MPGSAADFATLFLDNAVEGAAFSSSRDEVNTKLSIAANDAINAALDGLLHTIKWRF